MPINGTDLSPYIVISQDNIERREHLAEKILSGATLTPDDREYIYNLLTVDSEPKKKGGRKSEYFRDRALAQEYELLTREGLNTRNIQNHLAAKYKIGGGGNVEERTFYAALAKGRAYLAKYLEFSKLRAIRVKRKSIKLLK